MGFSPASPETAVMSGVPKQGAAVMTAELTVADVDLFISRMGKVRLAEERLTSALEGMAIEGSAFTPTSGDGAGPPRVKMGQSKKRRCRRSTGRQFSQAAREAAVTARKAKALLQEDIAAPRIFIVRHDCPSMPFTWEIRRFGGVVLVKGDLGFPSLSMAWAAGEAMLAEASPSLCCSGHHRDDRHRHADRHRPVVLKHLSPASVTLALTSASDRRLNEAVAGRNRSRY